MKLRELFQEEKFCVYKISNLINGKIYIGKTSNVNVRWEKHIKISENKEEKAYQYLHKSINKYGLENFTIEKIEDNLTEQESFDREKFWIKTLNSKNHNLGMNLTDGGEGTSGLKWSEDSREKIRGLNNHNFGKPLSKEVKLKLSVVLSGENNPFYGKMHSEKVISFLKNRVVSEEVKLIISKNCRGENQWNAKFSDADIIDIRNKWDSGKYTQTEIAKLYNVKPNTINQIVNRKRWTHI